jgi:hypothetical protein
VPLPPKKPDPLKEVPLSPLEFSTLTFTKALAEEAAKNEGKQQASRDDYRKTALAVRENCFPPEPKRP